MGFCEMLVEQREYSFCYLGNRCWNLAEMEQCGLRLCGASFLESTHSIVLSKKNWPSKTFYSFLIISGKFT